MLIDAKSGKVSGVPEWFDQAEGYEANRYPGALYNLKADLAQKVNLYGAEPERVARMKAKLEAIRERGEVRGGG